MGDIGLPVSALHHRRVKRPLEVSQFQLLVIEGFDLIPVVVSKPPRMICVLEVDRFDLEQPRRLGEKTAINEGERQSHDVF